eukprot:CAMPEP_0114558818 /NCGR_PEP_ID=MMETSP0114-20121206/10588_1 /TAXON_ID=31324 /ORGANISM="Goniomonas sp, Strain m" /LENGTH=229 /DNA_ID=CAMNT_0001744241 /DNA_START=41 /DNA_END=730 /DNA_ORIENTATION=-
MRTKFVGVLLVFVNLIAAVVAGVVTGFGGWSLSTGRSSSARTTPFFAALSSVGGLVVFICVTGLLGSLKRSRSLLLFYLVSIGFLVIAQVSCAAAMLAYSGGEKSPRSGYVKYSVDLPSRDSPAQEGTESPGWVEPLVCSLSLVGAVFELVGWIAAYILRRKIVLGVIEKGHWVDVEMPAVFGPDVSQMGRISGPFVPEIKSVPLKSPRVHPGATVSEMTALAPSSATV